jgi:hypothetical protein
LYQSIAKTDEYLQDFKKQNGAPLTSGSHGAWFSIPYDDCACSRVDNGTNPWGNLEREQEESRKIWGDDYSGLDADNYWVGKAKTRLKRNLSANGGRVLGDRKSPNEFWNSEGYLGDGYLERNSHSRQVEMGEERDRKVRSLFGDLDCLIGDLKKVGTHIKV